MMHTVQPLLELKNLKVTRGGVAVLDIPHLYLNQGESLCLIGPNGSGKSTLLLTLACLLQGREGQIIFRGQPIDSHNDRFSYRRNLAMVFQEPLLFDTTVFDNVASGLKIRGLRHAEMQQTVEECLEKFHIAHLARRSARKLSGGEAQRTSLARAFAIKPQLIFLDEPFSSLDPPTRDSLLDDLETILKETKTTVVMASHDQEESLRLADRMAVMNEGKIVQIGPAAEVINFPADEFVASFVGMEIVVKGRVTNGVNGTMTVSVNDHHIEVIGEGQPGDELILCIRPENVMLSKVTHHDNTSVRNFFPATIVKIIPKGLFYRINLDCGFFLSAYVTRQSIESLSLQEGIAVTASFKATAVHVIKK